MPDLAATLPTPCLLLDEPRMMANIARIHGRLAGTGVAYRAHLKTAKSVEVARRQMTGPHGPAMVSTLKEADILARPASSTSLYGVGIDPTSSTTCRALVERGVETRGDLSTTSEAEARRRLRRPNCPWPC